MEIEQALRAGLAHHEAGRLAEAADCYDRVLARSPEHAGALNLRGIVAQQEGRPEQALGYFERAAALEAGSASYVFNAGHACLALRRFRDAAGHYERARDLGQFGPVLGNNLGICLLELGRLEEAERLLRDVVGGHPEFADAWNNLGAVLHGAGRQEEAEGCVRRALALRPDFPRALRNLERIRTRQVPFWHFRMMNDAGRNRAFQAAIEAAVRPGDLVLDIGTGSGLLALMAARAGAGRVVACEMNPAVAEVARRTVRANGYGHVIEVVDRKSTDLAVGDGLERPADVLVTEVFDAGLLGEEALDTLEDARSRLLATGAAMVPGTARLVGRLVESPSLRAMASVDEVCGFDLSDFNAFRPLSFQQAVAELGDWRPLSEDFEIFAFDFHEAMPRDGERRLEVAVSTGGRMDAVVYWFELGFEGGGVFTTRPGAEGTHWEQKVWLPESPVSVTAGRVLALDAAHDRRSLRLSPGT